MSMYLLITRGFSLVLLSAVDTVVQRANVLHFIEVKLIIFHNCIFCQKLIYSNFLEKAYLLEINFYPVF